MALRGTWGAVHGGGWIMNDFHSSALQRARKEHTCDCLIPSREPHRTRRHTINPGEVYVRVFGVFDGNKYGGKYCRIHSAVIQALFESFPIDYLEEGVDYRYARGEWIEYIHCGGRPAWLCCLHAIRKELRETRVTGKAAV